MKNLKKSVYFSSVLLVTCLFACSKDDQAPTPTPTALEVKQFANLYAPQTGGMGAPIGGAFTKFNFALGDTVSGNNWDLAFRGTTILVNGGASVGLNDEPARTGNGAVATVLDLFNNVKTVPQASLFTQDGEGTYAIPIGSGNGWYLYDATTNLVTPLAGRIFVVKTHDNKYAKVEILSYYKDAPASPDATAQGRYFTFKYVFQPNGTSF